jgi:hypothetical protein
VPVWFSHDVAAWAKAEHSLTQVPAGKTGTPWEATSDDARSVKRMDRANFKSDSLREERN